MRVRSQIHQCVAIERDGMTDERVMRGDSLETLPRWADTPDVPVVWRNTADEIDVGSIRGPHREMTVHACWCHIDLVCAVLVRVLHEDRIARRGRVVDEATAVSRPGHLGSAGQVGLQRPAPHWCGQDVDVART